MIFTTVMSTTVILTAVTCTAVTFTAVMFTTVTFTTVIFTTVNAIADMHSQKNLYIRKIVHQKNLYTGER